MKRSFFQAVVMLILRDGCTTWMLTKQMEKKLDSNNTRMLQAIMNKSCRQHPTKQQLYGHLPPIMKTINARHWTVRYQMDTGLWDTKWTLDSEIPNWCRTVKYQIEDHEIPNWCWDVRYQINTGLWDIKFTWYSLSVTYKSMAKSMTLESMVLGLPDFQGSYKPSKIFWTIWLCYHG